MANAQRLLLYPAAPLLHPRLRKKFLSTALVVVTMVLFALVAVWETVALVSLEQCPFI